MPVIEVVVGMVIGIALILLGIHHIRRCVSEEAKELRDDHKTGRLIDQADIEKEFL